MFGSIRETFFLVNSVGLPSHLLKHLLRIITEGFCHSRRQRNRSPLSPYLKSHTQGKPPCVFSRKYHRLLTHYMTSITCLGYSLCTLWTFCCVFFLSLFCNSFDGCVSVWFGPLSTSPVDSDPRWTLIRLDLSCSQGEGLEIGLSSDWIVCPWGKGTREVKKKNHAIFWPAQTGVLH